MPSVIGSPLSFRDAQLVVPKERFRATCSSPFLMERRDTRHEPAVLWATPVAKHAHPRIYLSHRLRKKQSNYFALESSGSILSFLDE